MEIFEIVVLSISGLLLTMMGIMRLSNPIKTYSKNSGITLENNVDLLNEMRGVSALMTTGGIVVLLGTIFPKIRMISFAVASLIFLGFAIGRTLAIVLDGKPNKLIIQGLISELILGGLNIACLIMAFSN